MEDRELFPWDDIFKSYYGFDINHATSFDNNKMADPRFFDMMSGAGGVFFEFYKAFPASFMGKDEVEKGNKIILPGSAANRLV